MDLQEALKAAGLDSRSSSTNPDVLTEQDKSLALHHAKRQAMEYLIWRMKDRGCLPDQIEARIKATDWDNAVDREEVLRIANANKAHQIWQEQQRKDKDAAREREAQELVKKWDYARFYKLMKANSKYLTHSGDEDGVFIENEHTLPLIQTICFFMARDPRFSSDLGHDPAKGLLIRGACGLGKTFLFRCVAINPIRPVKIASMLEITDTVRSQGNYQVFFLPGDTGILYLDDVGTETEQVNHYGTKINWFKDFIESFYLSHKGDYSKLVISTNLSFDELQQKYGYRLRSRAKEMFNIINVTGEDLRH